MEFNITTGDINYVKLVYNDKEDNPHSLKTDVKMMSDRIVVLCAKYEDSLNIPIPQEVSLNIVCENGLYSTSTTLQLLDKQPPYVFFTVRTPQGLSFRQNREYFRVRMDCDVILSYKYKNDTYRLNAKLYDISASGVKIALPERINAPQDASLEIYFAERTIKLNAEFLRFDNEDNILKAAFKYIDIPDEAVNFISQKCIKKQLEDRRHLLH